MDIQFPKADLVEISPNVWSSKPGNFELRASLNETGPYIDLWSATLFHCSLQDGSFSLGHHFSSLEAAAIALENEMKDKIASLIQMATDTIKLYTQDEAPSTKVIQLKFVETVDKNGYVTAPNAVGLTYSVWEDRWMIWDGQFNYIPAASLEDAKKAVQEDFERRVNAVVVEEEEQEEAA